MYIHNKRVGAAIEDLKRKDFVVVKNLDPDSVAGADAVARVAADCRAASPFVAYLCAALDVPF